MARKVKCLYCSKQGTSDTFYKTQIKGANKYFCNSVEYDIYILNEENKKKIKAERDALITWIVEEFYDYEAGMVFPLTLSKRMKPLFDFYPLEVIRETFEANSELLYWAVKNKGLETEFNKTCYIMHVIEGSVNDAYTKFKQEEKQKEKMETKINDFDYSFIIDEIPQQNKPKATSANGGISRFLTEDDI